MNVKQCEYKIKCLMNSNFNKLNNCTEIVTPRLNIFIRYLYYVVYILMKPCLSIPVHAGCQWLKLKFWNLECSNNNFDTERIWSWRENASIHNFEHLIHPMHSCSFRIWLQFMTWLPSIILMDIFFNLTQQNNNQL